jgi:hypothetical protein
LNEKLEAERTHGDDEFVHEDLLAITLQPMLIMVSGDVARFRLAGMSKKDAFEIIAAANEKLPESTRQYFIQVIDSVYEMDMSNVQRLVESTASRT